MNNLTKLALTLLAACPILLGQAAANRNTNTQGAQQTQQQAQQAETQYVATKGLENYFCVIKHRDPNEIVKIIKGLGSGHKDTLIQANEMQDLKTITVRDFPENVAMIGSAIYRLDVPIPKAIDVVLQIRVDIIWASNRDIKGNPAPQHLSDVISTVSKTLNYKYFKEAAIFTTHTNGKADVTIVGKMGVPDSPNFPAPPNGLIDAMCYLTRPSYNNDSGILDSGFLFAYSGTRINSSLKIGNNEKIVIGTTFIGDIAMIAVVSMEKIR